MTNVALLRKDTHAVEHDVAADIRGANAAIASNEAIDYMGPARVVAVDGPRIVARRSDGHEVDVVMALALAYQPDEGDMVLLVGGRDGHFVIGVLSGSGRTRLAIAGDVDLHAVGGTLNIKGDRGVHIGGPEVEVISDSFKVIAGTAISKVTSLYQHVRELWSMKAQKAHIAVSDDIYQRSKSATVLTEEVITMNGKQIHLG